MSNKNSKSNPEAYMSHNKINIQANVDTDETAVAISGLGDFRSNKVQKGPGVYKYVEVKWISEASAFILNVVTEAQGKVVNREKVALSTKPQYTFNALFCACDQIQK